MVLLFIVPKVVTLAKNVSFELHHLLTWTWFGVTLPMDEESFKRKLAHLMASDKLGLIKEALVRVWSSVLFNWKPEDVYQAIFELYTVVDGIDLNTQPSTPSKTGRVDIAPEDALLQHWTGKYIGPSRDILRERIWDYERQFSDGYFKVAAICTEQRGGQVTTGRCVWRDLSYDQLRYVSGRT
jgi:hypothetical protein